MSKLNSLIARIQAFIDLSPDEVRDTRLRAEDLNSNNLATTSNIVQNTIRDVTAEWLSSSTTQDLKTQINTATRHVDETIQEATQVFIILKNELETQTQKLDELKNEIDEKTEKVNYLSSLAHADETLLRGFTLELENRLQFALEQQQLAIEENQRQNRLEEEKKARREKRTQRTIEFLSFWVTLILGAFLGALFQSYIEGSISLPW